MSSRASKQESRPFINLEDFTDDKRDNPSPYRQESLFEGPYVEDDADLKHAGRNCRLNHAGCSVGIDPGFQNPPQNPQYPPNPAYPHQLQDGQQSSQSTNHHQAQYGAYGPPPNYTANQDDVNGKLLYDASAPQGMPGAGQQPAYPSPPFHDPQSVAPTYNPPVTSGQYVVMQQPQDSDGQPRTIIVRPILENPPSDYMSYSVFATLCCCWCIGLKAISRSRECRAAILDGNRELAEEKSRSARETANVAVCLGIVLLIIYGVIIGIRLFLSTEKTKHTLTSEY